MVSTLNQGLHAYRVVGDPIAPLPVSVVDVLNHLKMDPDLANDAVVSAEITSLIEACIDCGEKETWLTFRLSNFIAYWDCLRGGNYPYEVAAYPLSSLTEIKYNSAGTEYPFDVANLEIKEQNGFSRIQPTYGQIWPTSQADSISLNNANITFQAGYAEDEFPSALKTALLMHVAALYTNRGDCVGKSDSPSSKIPCGTNAIYRKYSIVDLWSGA